MSDPPTEYAHPPLIEAWLGVEFSSPAQLITVDATEWKQRLGPEWPAVWQSIGPVERHAPAITQLERQLRNVMNDRAIRFGPAGFSFGWLGYEGSHYPRYEAIRDGFVATLDAVRDVIPNIGVPTKSYVTYVNRIPLGTVWLNSEDWSFFRLWQPNPLTKLKVGSDTFAGSWAFPLDADRGKLTIELTHEAANEVSTEIESLWLRITTSGPIDSDEASLFDSLDFGREMIVRAFAELTSTNAKQYWGVASRK
jgi:uncharacterized protein (TIGR04255 family)